MTSHNIKTTDRSKVLLGNPDKCFSLQLSVVKMSWLFDGYISTRSHKQVVMSGTLTLSTTRHHGNRLAEENRILLRNVQPLLSPRGEFTSTRLNRDSPPVASPALRRLLSHDQPFLMWSSLKLSVSERHCHYVYICYFPQDVNAALTAADSV